MKISKSHPRFISLAIRERLANAVKEGIAIPQGLIAHGRGEAFDYILGEKTTRAGSTAIFAAAAVLLSANNPVISVNGNTAALVGKDVVKLANVIHAPIEINLFHRTLSREKQIARYLAGFGAKQVLGIGKAASSTVPGISSSRRRTDPRGISNADVVLIPLEDGDRAEALERVGKRVISIDLNPLSRSSRIASVSIVDNVVRAVPALLKAVARMKMSSKSRMTRITRNFDNRQNLARSVDEIILYLRGWLTE